MTQSSPKLGRVVFWHSNDDGQARGPNVGRKKKIGVKKTGRGESGDGLKAVRTIDQIGIK